ncbi:uncharacterized protein V1516DRAFT_102093 [Lipomyces oligophaga]|uniref:uncharacterized protein n=1 Tax=Lipomyces oligophaga TaxID=45792 RepID=UPI0034CFA8B2
MSSKSDGTNLQKFIDESPTASYSFNGTNEQSKICRSDRGGRQTCLVLGMSTKELLDRMQKLEFICTLGLDVGNTDLECTKI